MSTQDSLPEHCLDSLIFKAPDGKLRTLRNDIPYQMDGLHWQAYVKDTERLSIARRTDGHHSVEVAGTVDGQQVARGYVRDVTWENEYNVVAVEPPW